MKVVFISNFISHHQKPFCEAMLTLLGNDFVFIATAPMDSERLEMGWRSESQPYVLRAYESKQNEQTAKHLARDADAVIIGSAPDSYMIPRLKSGKLTFKYAERFYKKGLTWKTIPRAVCGSWLHHGRFQRYPLYMLCASAYTASDCAVFGNYLNRTFRIFLLQKYMTWNLSWSKNAATKQPPCYGPEDLSDGSIPNRPFCLQNDC